MTPLSDVFTAVGLDEKNIATPVPAGSSWRSCNTRYASEVLKKDIRISLMLPCPISVYIEGGKTYISTLMPKVIAEFYPEAGIQSIAEEVDRIVLSIVDESK